MPRLFPAASQENLPLLTGTGRGCFYHHPDHQSNEIGNGSQQNRPRNRRQPVPAPKFQEKEWVRTVIGTGREVGTIPPTLLRLYLQSEIRHPHVLNGDVLHALPGAVYRRWLHPDKTHIFHIQAVTWHALYRTAFLSPLVLPE